MESPEGFEPHQPKGTPRASYKVAYFLCIFFGWFGAHRYYLRRWGTGILSTITAIGMFGCFYSGFLSPAYTLMGLLAFGVFFDLLTLPLFVRQRRDIEAGEPLPPDKAPWAASESRSWWGRLQLLLRFGILIFAPAITIVIAASLGQFVIVALVFILLAFSLLVGSIGRGLYALEDLQSFTQRVPLLPLAIGIVSRFQQHYFLHRARSVFFYLLYPVLGPIFMLFSPAARSEFKPFMSLFSLVVFAVLFQNVVSFLNIFPMGDYSHNQFFGVWVCLGLAAGGVGLFFLCVVPIVSSSFYLSMTGRSFSLRACAALALVFAGVAMLIVSTATSVSFRGSLTSMEKLNNKGYRQEFEWMNRVYLQHEVEHPANNQYKWNPNDVVWEEMIKDLHEDVHILPDSTDWYRAFMSSKLRPEESAAFRVLAIDPPDGSLTNVENVDSDEDIEDVANDDDGQPAAKDTKQWLAILFAPDPVGFGGFMGEASLLYVVSPEGEIFDRWSELKARASWIEGRFDLVSRASFHFRFFPNEVTTRAMIGDFEQIPSFNSWPTNLNFGSDQTQ